jgi:cytochrome b subunit of formate dehydrogenase
VIDDLLAQLPTARATWVLILTGLAGIAFSLSAFACDRLGHTIISPFLAAARIQHASKSTVTGCG